MPFVGRSSSAYLAVSALVGLSGCLLFTDPINEAPKVTIRGPDTEEVVRGQDVVFWIATLEDDEKLTQVEWAAIEAVNRGCSSITNANWKDARETSPPLDRNVSYIFKPYALDVMCICARATDSHGAVGFSSPCLRLEPQNAPPEARIVDVEGYNSEATRPLCSTIHLSAATSKFPTSKDDIVDFSWSLVYSGSDPSGANAHLGECSGVASDVTMQHKCFYAAVPGTYTVTLSITDTPSASVGGGPLTSAPVSFVAKVAADRPAWLRRTNPEWDAQIVVLSRSSDLGGSYESRTFEVTSVDDDCEPIPAPAGKREARLLWSIWGADKSKPDWEYQATSSKSLEVNQTRFPDALPGDVVKIRVEVLDAAADNLYKTPGYSPCPAEVDICCEAGDCASKDPPVRWTTWKVLFQP